MAWSPTGAPAVGVAVIPSAAGVRRILAVALRRQPVELTDQL